MFDRIAYAEWVDELLAALSVTTNVDDARVDERVSTLLAKGQSFAAEPGAVGGSDHGTMDDDPPNWMGW